MMRQVVSISCAILLSLALSGQAASQRLPPQAMLSGVLILEVAVMSNDGESGIWRLAPEHHLEALEHDGLDLGPELDRSRLDPRGDPGLIRGARKDHEGLSEILVISRR